MGHACMYQKEGKRVKLWVTKRKSFRKTVGKHKARNKALPQIKNDQKPTTKNDLTHSKMKV